MGTLPEKNLEFNMLGEDDPKPIASFLLGSMPKPVAAPGVVPPPPMSPPVGIVRVRAGPLGAHDVPMHCEPIMAPGSLGPALVLDDFARTLELPDSATRS